MLPLQRVLCSGVGTRAWIQIHLKLVFLYQKRFGLDLLWIAGIVFSKSCFFFFEIELFHMKFLYNSCGIFAFLRVNIIICHVEESLCGGLSTLHKGRIQLLI